MTTPSMPLGLPDGEWLLPVLAWTRPDGGDVRRPPALVLRVDHTAGQVRLAPPDGWRDLDTFYAVDAAFAGDQLVQMELTIPGALLGAEKGTTATWELRPSDDEPMTCAGSAEGSFLGTVAGDDATGSWRHDPERGLRIDADRDGERSMFSWMPRWHDDDVAGLEVTIHHQLGELVGGMQIRLG